MRLQKDRAIEMRFSNLTMAPQEKEPDDENNTLFQKVPFVMLFAKTILTVFMIANWDKPVNSAIEHFPHLPRKKGSRLCRKALTASR